MISGGEGKNVIDKLVMIRPNLTFPKDPRTYTDEIYMKLLHHEQI